MFTNLKFDISEKFIEENMMGPNSIIILKELLKNTPLKKGMKVLDLGCGRGLTSIFLAKEYDVNIYAVDLWTSAEENLNRFKQTNTDQNIIPFQADAYNLPFENEYFDAVISVDSYHYFGNNDEYFNKYLKKYLKKDAIIALAFPGMKFEIKDNIPEEMKPFWGKDILEMCHSIEWWKPKFENFINIIEIKELECFDEAWESWLKTDNPYAISDRDMIKTDNNKYMNLIGLIGIN